MSPLEYEIEPVALSYDHVRESDGPNDSPEIREFLKHVNILKPASYCAAFVSYGIWTAAQRVPVIPKFKRTAGAQRIAEKNPDLVITASEAIERLQARIPVIYIIKHKGGTGHTGFGFELLDDGKFRDFSGNTMPGPGTKAKDRDGGGCYQRWDRLVSDVDVWLRIA